MTAHNHIAAFKAMLGNKGVITSPDQLAPHLEEWRGKFFGKTDVMLAPASTAEMATAVAYCAVHKIAIVPQGGNSGLVGGSLPGLGKYAEILISTKRMNHIPKVDIANMSITAEAGGTVVALQQAAAEHGLLFPLSLASQGSCTVGGIISTNAGGVHVMRYGTTRALTLGIEAVLPNGEIYSGLKALRKDNTGYALDQLLIGAEGTLGIVTKATFKLVPAEVQKHTLWLAVDSPADAVALLSSARAATGERVSVFEIMPHTGLEFVLAHIPGTRNPLAAPSPWYILMEVATCSPDEMLTRSLTTWLGTLLEQGIISDGAVASSQAQAADFWRLRESMSEAQKQEGGSIKHDIAVPVSHIPAFLEETTQLLEKQYPGCRVTPFGHVGDGNLHYNVMQAAGADTGAFLAQWEDMNRLVHDQVAKFSGSISAEHGIGSLKKSELARIKPAAELEAMRQIKAALDPANIMNPNVLFY
jgi:FAD/FMN-containing dehydrogenase